MLKKETRQRENRDLGCKKNKEIYHNEIFEQWWGLFWFDEDKRCLEADWLIREIELKDREDEKHFRRQQSEILE